MAACLRGVGTRPQDIACDRTISGQGGMLESVRAAISVDISARATPVSRIVSGTLRSRGTSHAAIVTIERSFRSCAFACIAWLRLHPRYGRGCRRQAQAPVGAYPNRPVRLVVPYAPGGNIDITGRIVAPAMSDALGVSFVVDNRAGAGGAIGSDLVAKAAPDGYTLLVASTGSTSGLAALYPNSAL